MERSQFLALALGLPCAAAAQQPEEEPVRLPSGKLQRDEILKAEHKKAGEEAATLVKLAEELRAEIEKNEPQVLSLTSLKKTEEIEKLVRRIRGRLRQH